MVALRQVANGAHGAGRVVCAAPERSNQPHAHGRALLMDAHPRNTISHDDRFAAFGYLLARAIQRCARFSTIAELASSTLQQHTSQASDESTLSHRT